MIVKVVCYITFLLINTWFYDACRFILLSLIGSVQIEHPKNNQDIQWHNPYIWWFHVVSINGCPPKWMDQTWTIHLEMEKFRGTPILGNLHISTYIWLYCDMMCPPRGWQNTTVQGFRKGIRSPGWGRICSQSMASGFYGSHGLS